jgi:hypothetical protein
VSFDVYVTNKDGQEEGPLTAIDKGYHGQKEIVETEDGRFFENTATAGLVEVTKEEAGYSEPQTSEEPEPTGPTTGPPAGEVFTESSTEATKPEGEDSGRVMGGADGPLPPQPPPA